MCISYFLYCVLSLFFTLLLFCFFFFFFNDTATTEIYTLSLHDALPICYPVIFRLQPDYLSIRIFFRRTRRSEEHTSELQSRPHLVCRLLLEKKKKTLSHTQRLRTTMASDNTCFSFRRYIAPSASN